MIIGNASPVIVAYTTGDCVIQIVAFVFVFFRILILLGYGVLAKILSAVWKKLQ